MVPGGVGLVGEERKATGAAAPPPARPAAACAHTPSSRRPPARLTRGHHVSPEAPERRRPPRPGLRQERRARRRGPFPDRNVFPASTSPARLKELSPRDRRSKKRLKPGPDAASRPPQPPALPGPPLRLRSPARTPRAAVPGPAKRLWGKGKRQAHEHEGAKRGSCLSSPRHGNLTSRATGHTPAPLIGSGDYSNSRRPHPVAREASDWSVSHQARPSSPSLAGSVGRPGR
ncbi:splicing factor, proline- and glutamine-rich-like isoform X2 [Canis lupus familiaris]|uniref:splicing factor, proline- and glutamine-rich-like isoform X2 n=1 Tax=Canis lupus familiaris TaxID=9615 RepID=UPI0006B3CF52|nr:splicing factor, proline- and glutamine-rich-like isoform X2 [Canis lupus familiaris]|eukprot:XP_013962950.1 splicing factor, proline- and glutamine-rich-like [Canis lupus familiaris]